MDILKTYDITDTTESPKKIIFKLTSKEKVDTICPNCSSKRVVSHASRNVTVKDLPKKGKHVDFVVTFKRYRCKDCKKIILQDTPHISDRYNMTLRLEEYIRNNIFSMNFSGLAKEVGVTEGTIRHFFNDYCEDLKQLYNFSLPELALLAEIKLSNQQRLAIINPEYLSIVEMLRCVSHECIMEYAKEHKEMSYVVMETFDRKLLLESLSKVYDAALKTTSLGYKAKITAKNLLLKDPPVPDDKAISAWETKQPVLFTLYGLKNTLLDLVYASKNSDEATMRYQQWIKSLPDEQKVFFEDLIDKINEYGQYAFSWKDVDSLDTMRYKDLSDMLKSIGNRVPAASGFENAKARVLFNNDLHAIDGNINYGVSVRKWLEVLK